MNDLLEGTCESVWTCACPRLVESGIGMELERNGTIALAFGLKPTLRSDYILHAPLLARSLLRSAHMPWLGLILLRGSVSRQSQLCTDPRC